MHTTGPEHAATGGSNTPPGAPTEDTAAATSDAAAPQAGTDDPHGGPRDDETTVISVGAPAPWWNETLTAIDADAPQPTGGDVTLTHAAAYRYLALGLGLTDAALLHSSVPDPGHWESRVGVMGKGREDRAAAVAHLRAAGIHPFEADRMLLSGFTERHLTGALDMEQVHAVFMRWGHSAGEGSSGVDRPELVRDHLIDGSLPFELIEGEYNRAAILYRAAEFLFDPKAREQAGGTDADAEAILADRDSLPTVLAVWEKQPSRRYQDGIQVTLKTVWQGCRMFGDAYARTRPLGAVVPRDLTLEGCNRITEAIRNGYPVKQAAALLQSRDYTTEQALAAITGETSSAIAEGWL